MKEHDAKKTAKHNSRLRPGEKQCDLPTNNVIVWATKVGQKHLTLYKLPAALGS